MPPSMVFVRSGPLWSALRALPVSVFYVALAWALVAALPDRAWSVKTQALVAMGLFGAWRYAWQLLHVVRHLRYRRREFPRLRAAAMAQERQYPERLYVMVPSYREAFEVSRQVFEALVREAQTVSCTVKIYASVGSDEEIAFIASVIARAPGGSRVETVFLHQEAGKRVAMGFALRAIARDFNDPLSWHADAQNDVVVFMDGDTLVEPGLFRKVLPYFRSAPRLGALTVDNLGYSPDGAGVFDDWYVLKFAQRNHLFQSHSLSHRVLTITGRFSVYRASVVVEEAFIRFLEADHLDHWLFGRFRFLMGDDKSTWFYLLREGWEMLYVPDAVAVALETRQTRFLRTSLSLMHRWYGNMLRNNWRAIRLGPRSMGGFIWWCIVDQRISSFTPLVGPVATLLLGIFNSWFYLVFYAAWVILTRLGMLWVYVLEGMPLRLLHLPLMLYNQWVGAALKIYSLHSLDVQTWHKDADVRGDAPPALQRISALGKACRQSLCVLRGAVRSLVLALNVTLLVLLCGVLSGAFDLPGGSELAHYRTRIGHGFSAARGAEPADAAATRVVHLDPAGTASAINAAIRRAEPDRTLHIVLPAGMVRVDEPVRIDRSGVILSGAGVGATVLAAEPGSSADVVIRVGGGPGRAIGRLYGAANRGDTVLSVDDWPAGARHLLLEPPDGAARPGAGGFLAEVVGTGRGYVVLHRGLPAPFPAGSVVRAPDVVDRVALANFTVERAGADGDGVRFDWAARCSMRNVEVRRAGRRPLVVADSREVRVGNVRLAGRAADRGEIRFVRCRECELADAEVRDVRALVFGPGASDNRVVRSRIFAAVRFEDGAGSDNVVRDSVTAGEAASPGGNEAGAAPPPPLR